MTIWEKPVEHLFVYNISSFFPQYIRKHRPPKLTMEEALDEVLQEMRDY